MNEYRCEPLANAVTRYSKEALLYAGVRGAHDHLLPFCDYVLDGPLLFNGADLPKKLAKPVGPGRKIRWAAVHGPSRCSHPTDLLNIVLVDKVEPPSGNDFVRIRVKPFPSPPLLTRKVDLVLHSARTPDQVKIQTRSPKKPVSRQELCHLLRHRKRSEEAQVTLSGPHHAADTVRQDFTELS
jgi:hypothetical protein